MKSATLFAEMAMVPVPVLLLGVLAAPAHERPAAAPKVVSVRKIWDAGEYHMTTDLLRFKDRWLCTFREADGHVPGIDGKVRIIESGDGERWQSLALLAEPGIDLRDPKLSVLPDGRLLLLVDGSRYKGPETPKTERKYLGMQTRVAFSRDGRDWSALERVLPENEWLWRLTWHKGRAYGLAYPCMPKEQGLACKLYSTTDGRHYDLVTKLDDPGELDEATIRFLPDDTAVMLVRRDREDRKAWIGHSRPPYRDWKWYRTGYEVGGPDFIVLPDGRMFGGGRHQLERWHYHTHHKVDLARMSLDSYEPVLSFPGGHDCGYPAFAWHGGFLWMTYYSAAGGQKQTSTWRRSGWSDGWDSLSKTGSRTRLASAP